MWSTIAIILVVAYGALALCKMASRTDRQEERLYERKRTY